ncbi:MAG: protein-glutamate O-methyltransferase CheR [Gammaproteobacteria bacterium]|nr:protein-glutamate O-methyltransferase CheR [Gammaproteobacteria bacterium]
MAVTVKQDREYVFTEKDFNYLRRVANDYSGITVSDDKYDMYYARIAKRVRSLGLNDFSEYCKYLKNNHAKEFTNFINSITTNLTSFFRENYHFDYLASHIIPELKEKYADKKSFRIWCSAASTGEEPYSIAITLAENVNIDNWNIAFLATDIDSAVLDTAREGVYESQRIANLTKARKSRWFSKGRGENQGIVRVDDKLRNLISFKRLNLIQEWPLSKKVDVIFCRNVFIYFDGPTKENIIERYYDLLNDGGYLILGHSESIHSMNNDFETVGHTIYRKKA